MIFWRSDIRIEGEARILCFAAVLALFGIAAAPDGGASIGMALAGVAGATVAAAFRLCFSDGRHVLHGAHRQKLQRLALVWGGFSFAGFMVVESPYAINWLLAVPADLAIVAVLALAHDAL